jgi:nucleotide-binding universal stress UspA family protein
MEASIRAAKAALKMPDDETSATIEVEYGATPAVRIIRRVLRNEHDLLVKQTESATGRTGFPGVDMQLLRQCPCPVWLSRPIGRSRQEIRVAVAIDPQDEGPAAHSLALELLRFARSLADSCSGELDVISCWEYEFEETLRYSPWIHLPEDEIRSTVTGAESDHRTALDETIRESGIDGNIRVNQVRGRADRTIPSIVTSRGVDILVMGTLGRTGIPGFIIGNTAETILQQLPCSVVAMKPHGFVSPVKAY